MDYVSRLVFVALHKATLRELGLSLLALLLTEIPEAAAASARQKQEVHHLPRPTPGSFPFSPIRVFMGKREADVST